MNKNVLITYSAKSSQTLFEDIRLNLFNSFNDHIEPDIKLFTAYEQRILDVALYKILHSECILRQV